MKFPSIPVLTRISALSKDSIIARSISRKNAILRKAQVNKQNSYRQTPTTPTNPKRVLVELKYPLHDLASTESSSSVPLGTISGCPFHITRTKNNQLPVYSDLKNAGTRRLTILRNYFGDSNELVDEIQRLIGPECKIVVKTGLIEIQGHHVYKIKYWLKRLGF